MPPPDANGRIDLIQSEFNSYESTNATGMSATSSGTYYIGNSNPAAFVVPGTVFAEAQVSLSDTPSVLDFGGNSFFELDIGFTIQNSPSTISTNGETYTCTVFDNGTKIGSGTSTSVVGTGVMNGTMQEVDGCNATSNTTNTGSDYNDPNAQAGHTFVNLPNTTTYNINDTYTLILSH
jgi:hypothetical protein